MRKKTFKVQAVAKMLDISVDTVRRYCDEAGIEVQRQGGDGPKTRLFTTTNIFDLAAYRARKQGLTPKVKRIMTIYAPKGGVGKTTKASNIACVMALKGLRVLLIDLDFQANLTLAFGYDPEMTLEEARAHGLSPDVCINYHLGHMLPFWQGKGESPTLAQVIKKPFGENGPHLIPADVSLDELEAFFTAAAVHGKRPDLAIATFLHKGRKGQLPGIDLSEYDVIMFDAPPAKNQATRGALLASDFVVAPVSMEKYSTKSVSYLASVLEQMNNDYSKFPDLVILGNFFDTHRKRVGAQVDALTRQYPDAWLDKQVSTSEEFKKVLSDDEMMPLVLARPTSTPAEELNEVTEALIAKMGIFQ